MTTSNDWGFGAPSSGDVNVNGCDECGAPPGTPHVPTTSEMLSGARKDQTLPEPIIGNAYLSLLYQEHHADLARIHRMTPKQALTALMYICQLNPEVFERVRSYVNTFYDKEVL
jgi:hypothetical protein